MVFKLKSIVFVENVIVEVFKKFNVIFCCDVVLVVMYIWWGDMIMKNMYGYEVVIFEYFYKVVDYFNNFLIVVYVVCFIDLIWIKVNMFKIVEWVYFNIFNVYLENDFVFIVFCDYVIIMVGMFGWWGVWFFGGFVIYYKWFVRDGMVLRKGFSEDFMDFFYLKWVGYW